MRHDYITRLVQICLDIANVADERGEVDKPYFEELGLGYRALSGILRRGCKEIIDLQNNSRNRGKENGMDELKRCPFCGSKVDFMTIMTGLKMFYCKNYRECGAIVSFDNPAANSFDQAKIDCWNRRTADEK